MCYVRSAPPLSLRDGSGSGSRLASRLCSAVWSVKQYRKAIRHLLIILLGSSLPCHCLPHVSSTQMSFDGSALSHALQNLFTLALPFSAHDEARYWTVVRAVGAITTVLERQRVAAGSPQERDNDVVGTTAPDTPGQHQALLTQHLLTEAADEVGTSHATFSKSLTPYSEVSTVDPQRLLESHMRCCTVCIAVASTRIIESSICSASARQRKV